MFGNNNSPVCYRAKWISLLTAAVLLITTWAAPAYAGTWQQTGDGPSGGWQYLKDDGTYAASEILIDDSTRDIYAFDSSGKMYANTTVDGIFYDGSGRYQCPNARYSQTYDAGFEDFLNTGIWRFDSWESLLDAMNYVSYNKLLGNPIIMTTFASEGPTLYADRNPELMEEIEKCKAMSEMIDSIVSEAKKNAQDGQHVMANISKYIIDKATYTTGYGVAWDILSEGKGVCNAYAQLFAVLCSSAGYQVEVIPTETIIGIRGKHAINRVLLEDGKWHYYDVTGADQPGGEVFLDMNNEWIFANYKLMAEGLYR